MAEVRQKRYQFWGKNGKEWTEWFDYDGADFPKEQIRGLKNEYRIINR